MKMNSTLFWGLLLIIIGLSFIFKIVFNVDFPLFRVIFAFILIYLGVRMLVRSPGFSEKYVSEENAFFNKRKYKSASDGKDYAVIFGSGEYDFRDYDPSKGKRSVKVSCIFGGAEVKISKDTPVRIRVDAVFAGVNLPNGNSAVFGNSSYESPSFNRDLPYLDIKLESVFGGIDVRAY
jgi:predicted membrane protein